MEYNFGGLDFIALASEELEAIEVKEVFLRQVSYVQAREFVLLFLGLVVSLTTATDIQVLELLFENVLLLLLLEEHRIALNILGWHLLHISCSIGWHVHHLRLLLLLGESRSLLLLLCVHCEGL